MGLDEARQAMESSKEATAPVTEAAPESSGGEALADAGNAGLAPDSAQTSQDVLDLDKTEKFMFEGKEWTAQELKKAVLRQQDYTKKTQSLAEQKRQYETERETYMREREDREKYDTNLDIDIENVLRDPSLVERFKTIYPKQYHAKLEKALGSKFGDSVGQKNDFYEQRFKALEGRFHQQEIAEAKQKFEAEIQTNSTVLESIVDRLSSRYPSADEDSVLAKAEHLVNQMKNDESFKGNFNQMMEKLYKENNDYHEKRYQEMYKNKVDSQKQANAKGKDVGRGGQTAGSAPTKMKLKDVKNHIMSNLGR